MWYKKVIRKLLKPDVIFLCVWEHLESNLLLSYACKKMQWNNTELVLRCTSRKKMFAAGIEPVTSNWRTSHWAMTCWRQGHHSLILLNLQCAVNAVNNESHFHSTQKSQADKDTFKGAYLKVDDIQYVAWPFWHEIYWRFFFSGQAQSWKCTPSTGLAVIAYNIWALLATSAKALCGYRGAYLKYVKYYTYRWCDTHPRFALHPSERIPLLLMNDARIHGKGQTSWVHPIAGWLQPWSARTDGRFLI